MYACKWVMCMIYFVFSLLVRYYKLHPVMISDAVRCINNCPNPTVFKATCLPQPE